MATGHTRKYNFIYAYKKGATFPASIWQKLLKSQPHYSADFV